MTEQVDIQKLTQEERWELGLFSDCSYCHGEGFIWDMRYMESGSGMEPFQLYDEELIPCPYCKKEWERNCHAYYEKHPFEVKDPYVEVQQ
jgi:hypothetical protein